MARNVHKSVFNALDLGHQRASILPTEVDNDTLQYVKPILSPSHLYCGKLAVLTYPNYYGQTFDIQSTIQHFHQQHIPVLVDEAHGRILIFKDFPILL